MKLDGYRETYQFHTGKASEVARQLSFAGIALIWVFRNAPNALVAVPQQLVLPTKPFVIALALDLLQYLAGTIAWGTFVRHHEGAGTPADEELDASMYRNWPALAFFWGKMVAVLLAYYLVLQYLQIQLQL